MSASSNPIESSGVPHGACRPAKVFKGHTTWVNSVEYFPDGRRIASASRDKTVIIWDVESGRQDGQPLLHNFRVEWMVISPDGRRIASTMEEGGVVIWDALTRKIVHEIKDGVWRLAYSPDGRWIATAPSNNPVEIQLYDADSGRPGSEPLKCDGRVWCMAFSPDGSRIAVGLEYGFFQVFDVLTGESVLGPIKGHTDWVLSIVYSPDGHLLVTGSDDNSIRAWDSKTGVEVGKPLLGWHESEVKRISLTRTAHGRRLASAGRDKAVRVWDLETRLQVGHSLDAGGFVRSVAFSPDGRYLVGGGSAGLVSLWDTESSAIQGLASLPPTTSTQSPPAPITPLRQHRQVHTKSHNNASSINSSLLDLPAVVHQQIATQRTQERKPSVDDDFWDTESIRPRLRPTEPQRDSPREQDTSTVQLAASGRNWSRNIRERWRHIWHRKPRVLTDLSDCPPRPPIPLHERADSPASPELSTNRQTRREKDADANQTAQGSDTRTRPSSHQIEANVALGQADVRLAIAAPRGRKGRRFRARAQRGGVQANSQSDTDSESEDSDAESEYVDTGCLDAICFGEYFRRRRHLRGR